MNRKTITVLLLGGAALSACHNDMSSAPPPVTPSSEDFNAYVKTTIMNGNQVVTEPLPVDRLTFTFNDNDPTVFDALVP